MDLRPCLYRLLEQNFGMCLSANDYIVPFCVTPSKNYYRPWKWIRDGDVEDFGSTIVEEKDYIRILLDVQYFKHNELSVKANDKEIIVEGRHQEREDQAGYVSRQFMRKYFLPRYCNSENVSSTLSSDGILTIIAEKNCDMSTDEKSVIIKRDDVHVKPHTSSKTTLKKPYNTQHIFGDYKENTSKLDEVLCSAKEIIEAKECTKAETDEISKGTLLSKEIEVAVATSGYKDKLKHASTSKTSESLLETYGMKTDLETGAGDMLAGEKFGAISKNKERSKRGASLSKEIKVELATCSYTDKLEHASISKTSESALETYGMKTDLETGAREMLAGEKFGAISKNKESSEGETSLSKEIKVELATCGYTDKSEHASTSKTSESVLETYGMKADLGTGASEMLASEKCEAISKNIESSEGLSKEVIAGEMLETVTAIDAVNVSAETKSQTFDKSKMQVMLRDQQTALVPKEIFERKIDSRLVTLATDNTSEAVTEQVLNSYETRSNMQEEIEESRSFKSKDQNLAVSASSTIKGKNRSEEMYSHEITESINTSSITSLQSSAAELMSSECQFLNDIITAELEEAAENE